jgi:hypothetical protein
MVYTCRKVNSGRQERTLVEPNFGAMAGTGVAGLVGGAGVEGCFCATAGVSGGTASLDGGDGDGVRGGSDAWVCRTQELISPAAMERCSSVPSDAGVRVWRGVLRTKKI